MISRRLLLTAAGAATLVGTPVWATETDPDAWILEMSNKILNDIRGNAKLAAADPAEVKKFVDNVVMPAVDFLRMTRMAVGPKWRQATAEQRTELQRLFRAQLTNVYSGALATVKDQTVKLAPNRVKPTETGANSSCVARQTRYAHQLSLEEGKRRMAHHRRGRGRHLAR